MPLIWDAHLDLAWNAIDWNRDLKQPVADIRRREIDEKIPGKGRGVFARRPFSPGEFIVPYAPKQQRLDVRGIALLGSTLLAAMFGIAYLGSDRHSPTSLGFLIPEGLAACALIGMAAFFTASVHAPVTGLILATEMTGNTNQLPPMLGACAIALLVARHENQQKAPARAR